ncbi:MAG: hypothetical protein PVJ84_14795 [Desulfobacteraceae bacterium]|jgi:hypothetical protein
MEYTINHDAMGTHIDWKLEGVTAHMIDWFWSNMEKAFILWHPSQHEPLQWEAPPVHGNPVGSIHIAPQTWNDGRRQNLYIRFEALSDVPEEIRDYIVYEHVVIVAGLGLGEACLDQPDPMGYRIHQWERRDYGVAGKSSGIGTRKKETVEDGKVWAAHCAEEIGNWAVFLPQLFELYKVVKCHRRNPFADLSVTGKGREARYAYIK